MFGRVLLGLALCLTAAGDGAGAGAGAAGGAAGGAGAGGAGPSAADLDKVRAEASEAARKTARAEFLKELGFDDEEAYAKHKKAKADEENAKLSEGERTKKLYNEALDARGKAEAKLEAEKAARKAAEEALALRDRFDAQGVLPGERKFVEVALSDAEAAAKKASETFDEAKFFKDLRDKRPYFFSKEAPQLANTGTNTGTNAGASKGTGNGATNGLTFNAGELSDADWAKWRQQHNV